MVDVTIREPRTEDRAEFISAMKHSQSLHHPWVSAPTTDDEFDEYIQRYQQTNQMSFMVCDSSGSIVGVINLNEIVHGRFQNAYLGFYVVYGSSGKGYMSSGLNLVLKKVFNELNLHRIEANIQPENTRSIQFVKKNGFRYEGFSPRYLFIDGQWCGHEHWVMTLEDFVVNNKETLESDHVEIVPYNQAWPDHAMKEIKNLRRILPENAILGVHHVGSTSVPGLSAKAIIDIQIVVRSLDEMKAIAISALQKIGYEYWADNPDSERMFFVKGMPPFGEKRTHHIHIVEETSKQWGDRILFRDYLIAHPEMAKEYEQLKMKLAKEHIFDREQYTESKGEFVKKILGLAH